MYVEHIVRLTKQKRALSLLLQDSVLEVPTPCSWCKALAPGVSSLTHSSAPRHLLGTAERRHGVMRSLLSSPPASLCTCPSSGQRSRCGILHNRQARVQGKPKGQGGVIPSGRHPQDSFCCSQVPDSRLSRQE